VPETSLSFAEQNFAVVDRRGWKAAAVLAGSLGVMAIAMFAAQSAGWGAFATAAALALVVSGAAAMLGALLGFLFGIPRTSDGGGENGDPVAGGGAAVATGKEGSPAARPSRYRVNTALQQISDWLTKILVGVGLTQLNQLPTVYRRLAESLGSVLPDRSGAGVFLVTIATYFVIFGFLAGYICTRTILSLMFKEADERLDLVVERAEKAQRRVDDLTVQAAELNHVLNEMLRDLYDVTQRGFVRAIDRARGFLASGGQPNSWIFWLRLAAAHGQQANEAAANNDKATYDAARDGALAAARTTIAQNPVEGRAWLRDLWRPNPQQLAAGEDDLHIFDQKADAAFEGLLA
jgi:hypothetical protein